MNANLEIVTNCEKASINFIHETFLISIYLTYFFHFLQNIYQNI